MWSQSYWMDKDRGHYPEIFGVRHGAFGPLLAALHSFLGSSFSVQLCKCLHKTAFHSCAREKGDNGL